MLRDDELAHAAADHEMQSLTAHVCLMRQQTLLFSCDDFRWVAQAVHVISATLESLGSVKHPHDPSLGAITLFLPSPATKKYSSDWA